MAEKANKRELILAAAREIFGEKGYHTATSEEIAKRAGVGKGTIYQYFDSKQEIFTEMHMLYLKQYSENVTALIHENESFEQNLRRLAHFHIEHLHELAQYGVQMLSEIHPATISCEEGHALMENLKKQLGIEQFWFIEKAKQRGEIREIDSNTLIYSMMGIFIGISHMLGPQQLNEQQKEKLEEDLVKMVLYGLKNNKTE